MPFVTFVVRELFDESKNMPINDLREFIDAARKLGEVKDIHGAHWQLEIGALTELFAFKEPSPLVLFDQVPGYAPNFRVASNLINTPSRSSLTVGMPHNARPIELIAKWKELLKGVKPVPPRIVTSGPILENVKSGADVDMTIFPTPHWQCSTATRRPGRGSRRRRGAT